MHSTPVVFSEIFKFFAPLVREKCMNAIADEHPKEFPAPIWFELYDPFAEARYSVRTKQEIIKIAERLFSVN